MWNERKVLITGGAGFIGSEMVRQLAAEGAEIIVVDNLVNGRRENLEGVSNDLVKLFITDIRDNHIGDLMQGVDVLFHLACLGVRHSIHSPYENHNQRKRDPEIAGSGKSSGSKTSRVRFQL